jgi:hypothetical protein
VTVEQPVIGASPDLGELVGEIDRIADAAVHPHPPERIVDVGGIAREQHAAKRNDFATRWCTRETYDFGLSARRGLPGRCTPRQSCIRAAGQTRLSALRGDNHCERFTLFAEIPNRSFETLLEFYRR